MLKQTFLFQRSLRQSLTFQSKKGILDLIFFYLRFANLKDIANNIFICYYCSIRSQSWVVLLFKNFWIAYENHKQILVVLIKATNLKSSWQDDEKGALTYKKYLFFEMHCFNFLRRSIISLYITEGRKIKVI